MNKRVIILAPYSHPSACGIWQRVYSDAKALVHEGFDVHVFTSNRIKGTGKISEKYEEYEGIKIHRFKVLFSLGGTSMFWFFLPKLIKLKPAIIHTHGFRHPHSLLSLITGKILRKKVILTTHAPFGKDPRRSWHLKAFDVAYDIIFSWWELRLYDKVIRISRWETKYLKRLGRKNSEYIPNGIDKDFLAIGNSLLNSKKFEAFNQVLYMGRIDPVKRVEWLIRAAEKLPNIDFKIVGPVQNYDNSNFFTKIAEAQQLKTLTVIDKKYEKQEFIDELVKSDIYVLPSIREALGITLLEAMATGRIVIASNAKGPKDIIIQSENGFIVKNESELVEAIEYVYNDFEKFNTMRFKAIETARKYSEERVNKKLISLYDELGVK